MKNCKMITNIWHKFTNIDYKFHIFIGFAIRILLVQYGIYHDENSTVPYTDVDYKVFTDAARHVLHNSSPYNRHTYRYTPLIAILLTPNLLLNSSFGKVLFCVVDILGGLLIRLIVKNSLNEYDYYKQKILHKTLKNEEKVKVPLNDSSNHEKINREQSIRGYHSRPRKKMKLLEFKKSSVEKKQMKTNIEITADISMLLWLYNPLTIAIATRGNCDSISGFLVLVTLYLLQCKRQYFLSGLVHGLSIHVRLYPLMYSLALFMHLSKFSFYSDYRKRPIGKSNQNKTDHQQTKELKIETKTKLNEKSVKQLKNKHLKHEKFDSDKNAKTTKDLKNVENQIINNENNKTVSLKNERKTIFKKQYLYYVIPNRDQLKLVMGCLISLSFLTALFYLLYGYQFLYESYIYHLIRKDTRHNFSLYFYLQYLTAGVKNIGLWQKVLTVLPQIILLLVFSVRYGLNKFTLNFSILTLTIVMVSYNTVITSQYFVWILAILPLCFWQIKMAAKTALFLGMIWLGAQVAWLLPAYFLEFRGQNTFIFIWIQSVSFFCANMAILGRLIINFMPSTQDKVE